MASRREQAGLPSYAEQRWVTLCAMRGLTLPATNDEISDAVADALNLTEAQRSVMHVGERMTEVSYCVMWAKTALRATGAIERVSRALWTVTPEGRSMTRLTVDERYERHTAQQAAKRREKKVSGRESGSTQEVVRDDPEPLPETDWKEALLDTLASISPSAFEHLSGALLLSAGFDDVEVTGRSGDGGIDGIGTYRPLGLISFHTAFQCKRYQGSVGASAVRDFRGSFVGRSDRGIIITTGAFTRDAREEANRPGANPVDLIDGDALCDLLRERSLGVRTATRVVEDVTIDDDYFDQFEDSQ